ncbi:hypothetical protein BDQ12DRAFT_775025 [Crucibulum laeve]|uniref:Uncharacterized protein n=1 Tax=Crucibulum laeve TaxID=68775 RepID=A0A5C3LTR1_9AGAR|nr:hypothetical protein BDQ12DRAFT_775025 [Crucibulum laeve]
MFGCLVIIFWSQDSFAWIHAIANSDDSLEKSYLHNHSRVIKQSLSDRSIYIQAFSDLSSSLYSEEHIIPQPITLAYYFGDQENEERLELLEILQTDMYTYFSDPQSPGIKSEPVSRETNSLVSASELIANCQSTQMI